MLGSVVTLFVGAGVVVVGEEPEVLEDDGSGLAFPPHPATNIEAANNAAEIFFTVPPAVMSPNADKNDRSEIFGRH
jgi:hypothetical protein